MHLVHGPHPTGRLKVGAHDEASRAGPGRGEAMWGVGQEWGSAPCVLPRLMEQEKINVVLFPTGFIFLAVPSHE